MPNGGSNEDVGLCPKGWFSRCTYAVYRIAWQHIPSPYKKNCTKAAMYWNTEVLLWSTTLKNWLAVLLWSWTRRTLKLIWNWKGLCHLNWKKKPMEWNKKEVIKTYRFCIDHTELRKPIPMIIGNSSYRLLNYNQFFILIPMRMNNESTAFQFWT